MRYQQATPIKRSNPLTIDEWDMDPRGTWDLDDFEDLIHASRRPKRSPDAEAALAQFLG